MARIPVVTVPSLEGARVTEYLGIVSGHAILGANLFRDFTARVRDKIGGRSEGYEKELRHAEELALEEVEAEAIKRGAHAVIGLTIDYEPIAASGSLLMCAVAGTAVRLERIG